MPTIDQDDLDIIKEAKKEAVVTRKKVESATTLPLIREGTIEKQIYDAMKVSGLTDAKKIADAAGVEHKGIGGNLSHLVRKRLVRKIDAGHYTLTDIIPVVIPRGTYKHDRYTETAVKTLIVQATPRMFEEVKTEGETYGFFTVQDEEGNRFLVGTPERVQTLFDEVSEFQEKLVDFARILQTITHAIKEGVEHL